jgi:NAD(P)-dependent dehydrogenase (short-subunit alcohol dehydrogenase family)
MLDGQVALITGAASGIGEACALAFAREGAKLCLTDRAGDAVKALAERICSEGGEAIGIEVDVSDRAQVDASVQAALDRFGRLTCAVNSAGIGSPDQLVGDMSDEHWQRQMSINLTGTFYSVRAEIAAIRLQGEGSVINISSGAGLKGIQGLAHYASAKHGVIGLTKSAALDHAKDGIRVNAICPGYIETPIHQRRKDEGRPWDIAALSPLGRAGRAEEIADAAIWLASSRSSFVTGIALPVDGGFAAQ